MAIDERSRHRLHGKLEEALGAEEAAILMEHLPPTGWAEVATKRDLDMHATAMKTDLDMHATAMKTDLDMHTAAMKSGLADLETRFETRFETQRILTDRLGDQLRAEFYQALTSHTRTIVLSQTATMAILASLAFAAARIV